VEAGLFGLGFIAVLSGQLDELGGFLSELQLQPVFGDGDGHVFVAEPPCQIEGLARRLLEREPQRVLRHGLLDCLPHLRRGAEVPVCGYETAQRLVRPAEVVRLDEERHAPLAVGEVGEHRAGEELVPQRLPEALHLAQRLRMLRPAHHMSNAVLLEQGFEGGLAAPRGVLPALVRQHLLRRAVSGDAALESFTSEAALLVVRQHVRDDEARVVVHEGRHVDALVPSQQEGEDVRLPQLIRLGSLEAALGGRHLRQLRRLVRQQPFFVQDASHLRRRHAERLEALQTVGDFPRPEVGECLLHRDYRIALRVGRVRRFRLRLAAGRLRVQRALALRAERLHPVVHRLARHAEDVGHL